MVIKPTENGKKRATLGAYTVDYIMLWGCFQVLFGNSL